MQRTNLRIKHTPYFDLAPEHISESAATKPLLRNFQIFTPEATHRPRTCSQRPVLAKKKNQSYFIHIARQGGETYAIL